ncbi:MAG: beta-ketoacyl synthase N-terminal-like domain-containing protein, partial [Candidatus Hydrogenedentota bacterium]
MSKSVAIIGAGVVTALGAGIDANWKALLGARTGIKLLTRFPETKYISDVGAEVNEDTLDT